MRTVDNILAVGLNRGDIHVNGEVKLFIFIKWTLPTRTALGACPSLFTVTTLSRYLLTQISSTPAGPSGRVVEFDSLWPLACRSCGLESRRGMDVCLFVCCVLSGRGLCVGLITRPENSYRLW